ncbi:MAG: hypothetical protein COB66_04010 [Coxiella sp. (in: Bacteria)]|nr:MAG: hypothetical protein COB66_04010 [Coxiella sp. (in: g-proteobacteria)]
MVKLYKLGILCALAGVSASVFAAPSCAELATLGNSDNSAIQAAAEKNGLTVSYVDNCLSQCSTLQDPNSCIKGLSVMEFAVNYNDSLLSPTSFTSTSGYGSTAPAPSSYASPVPVTSTQATTPAATASSTSAPANNSYITVPKKTTTTNNTIHWY